MIMLAIVEKYNSNVKNVNAIIPNPIVVAREVCALINPFFILNP